jgi:heterotetrameric sarcosine oxidase gamma subunit
MRSPEYCTIERQHQDRVLEFVAFRWPLSGFGAADWPTEPGGVLRDAAHRPLLLHFSPGRWLAPAPTPVTESLFDATARAGSGRSVDVSGKWQPVLVAGPGAARLLACALDIAAVLERRDCAAAVLFDCPAVVARSAGGFELWVQASYAVDFLATAGRFAAELGREA